MKSRPSRRQEAEQGLDPGFGAKLARTILNNINVDIQGAKASYGNVVKGLAFGLEPQGLSVLSTNRNFQEVGDEVVLADGSLYKLLRLQRLAFRMADAGCSEMEGARYALHPVSRRIQTPKRRPR